MPTDAMLLAARLLMAILFAAGAVPKLMLDPGERKAIADLGVPTAGFLEFVAGLCQLCGAAMLALGIGTRIAASLLALFVLIVTPLFIRFWTVDDPAQRAQLLQAFFGNVGVLGGLVALVAAGPGGLALMPTL